MMISTMKKCFETNELTSYYEIIFRPASFVLLKKNLPTLFPETTTMITQKNINCKFLHDENVKKTLVNSNFTCILSPPKFCRILHILPIRAYSLYLYTVLYVKYGLYQFHVPIYLTQALLSKQQKRKWYHRHTHKGIAFVEKNDTCIVRWH